MKVPAISLLALSIVLGSGAFWWQAGELSEARSALTTTIPGDIDVGFSQSMSLHHQQAISMAQLMLDGRPTGLAPLARGIASSQLLELGEMRGWLRLWNEPLLPPSASMVWMLMGSQPVDEALTQYLLDCERSPSGMPGLASVEELRQLRRLDGRARDELFLRLMVAHHEGGIPMARFAALEARLPQLRQVAGNMLLEQQKEVQQMRSILNALEGLNSSQASNNLLKHSESRRIP